VKGEGIQKGRVLLAVRQGDLQCFNTAGPGHQSNRRAFSDRIVLHKI